MSFSLKLDWGCYIISIVKIVSKKIRTLIRSMKFLSAEVALYLCKSTIRLCMEYCCHVLGGASSCYLELLDSYKNGYVERCWSFTYCFSWTLGSSSNCSQLKSFLQVLLLVDVYLNWLNWFHFLILEGGQLVILLDCMIFLSPFLDVTRMSLSTVSFLAQPDSGILCL